ncbi:MAG: HPF/RaiA family ribosome-associated protein [Flavobacteriaceae bacterium]|nr:HPF/RaiA family ribosome-associated protein [Flavobacteriaceae bacterium]
MHTIFEYQGTPSSESLERRILNKMERLKAKYDDIIRAFVFLQYRPDHPKAGKICKIRLSLPGPLLFAEANTDSFDTSYHEVIHELDAQLRKRKEKLKDL